MWSKSFFISTLIIVFGTIVVQSRPVAPPTCSDPAARLFHDYSYLVGSADFSDPDGDAESGSSARWWLSGAPTGAEPVVEGLLLHFDGSAEGVNGELPTLAQDLVYTAGKWGSALALPAGGRLEFAREHNLDLAEGTVELWVALRADGADPVYDERQVLFYYRAPNGDYLQIVQSNTNGVLYGSAVVNGERQSAYGSLAGMRDWQAGDWHHLAFTYSASGGFMRFYVDGLLAADANGGQYLPPAGDGGDILIGVAPYGDVAHYLLDELRLAGRAAPDAEIAAHARRLEQPRANEVWRSTAQLTNGDTVAFEFTPATDVETGRSCQSAPLVYSGIPITNPQPLSTLLPPGATDLELAVQSIEDATCAYAVGEPFPFDEMTAFDEGAGSTTHSTIIGGLNRDPNTLNDVYVRCASHPDYVLHLRYRSLSTANPPFPRTGNLWGWWDLFPNHDLSYLAQIDLWLGMNADADQMGQLRQLNPHVRMLTSINAVQSDDVPSLDYYLKDVNGNLIEVWPGSYRLNLTKPEVAEYQAYQAYQTVLDTGLMADGVFFDNVMTTQAWVTQDIYGNPVQIDADEDGVPDDPDALDAAWKAGVFHEIETFRQLMPYAIVSGHSLDIHEPGIAELFNGISRGFWTADVLEGQRPFHSLWQLYHDWIELARQPAIVMFESSPQDQIAYGYDYSPWDKVPPSTLEFARTYYPYMRFGLALTLMNDGYFTYEFGDTWHGNDWWYDEFDFDLGDPLGPAERIAADFDPGPNRIENGRFELPIVEPWRFSVNTSEGNQASVVRDPDAAAEGTFSARVIVTATSGAEWHIALAQYNRTLVQGVSYDLAFWAKSDRPRDITLSARKDGPDWRNYGLDQRVQIGADWQAYSVSFDASETVSDARIEFLVGEVTGTVWLDDVRLTLRPTDVYRRAFTNGLVLLNGTRAVQRIDLGPGYRRLAGSQASRHEMILDDGDEGFAPTVGTWVANTYDSGGLKASGPFYHDWGASLHELSSASGQARWDLPIGSTDIYTITAWWPAAPEAAMWSRNVRYEVVTGGRIVASSILDQTTGGDEWHLVAEASLSPGGDPYVRIVCADSTPCVADALHIRSAARYNDGSPAEVVVLQPLDGIILQRGWAVYLPSIAK